MQAIILAGGKGTRLRPYTTVIPKPLMPVGDIPIVAVILRQLMRAGFTEVFLAVNYLHHLFEAVLGQGDLFGLKVHYSLETQELGTAGPIAMVLDRLDDNFLVMNGDVLTTFDYSALFNHHVSRGCDATIGVHTRQVNIDFGVVKATEDGLLRGYDEKPTLTYDVSMGINVLKREAVRPFLRMDQRLDLPTLMLNMAQAQRKVCCFKTDSFWLDIGRIDDYHHANSVFESMRGEFIPE